MLTQIERLVSRMMGLPRSVVRDAILMWEQYGRVHEAESRALLEADGWEVVDVATDVAAMPDGREVMRVGGTAYVLPIEEHRRRLAAELSARHEVRQTTKSVVGTESLSQIVCPKCGDSLQHTRVCPACPAGKLGYCHRYTCVCGSVDFVSKGAL